MSILVMDTLPPTEYLVMEVLTARHRLGEHTWTFPTRIHSDTFRHLEDAGLIGWKPGVAERTYLAWLTEKGKAAALFEGYTAPADRAKTAAVER